VVRKDFQWKFESEHNHVKRLRDSSLNALHAGYSGRNISTQDNRFYHTIGNDGQVPMNTQRNAFSGDIKHNGEIFIVDDDDCVRDILTAILSLEGYPVAAFADGDTFLKEVGGRVPVCVFLDIVMPGRSGIEVLKELAVRRYAAPIFLISAQNDTPVVVEALKNGAHDFLPKPFDPYAAVLRVRDAVELWKSPDEVSGLEAKEFPGQARLTRREAEVLAQVVKGASSKDASNALGIGRRTVDNYRMSIMKKLGAKNVADLVRIVMN
jgi:two-component system, LuxR family, response regulator FixJ